MEQKVGSLISAINESVGAKKPFLFIIDFNCEHPIVRFLNEIDPEEILYDFKGFTNLPTYTKSNNNAPFYFRKFPIPYSTYRERFDRVRKELLQGNSYLLNLTFPTPVETSLTLQEIFIRSEAPYKLLLNKDNELKFVVFSPESFVNIKDGVIRSFPMKGTINASVPNAENIILKDAKELAEHSTIVDLIRNDLSMVANNVKLERFRYVERIKTNVSQLLQISSEISGTVKKELRNSYGELLALLLPAGSISGAPKCKTVQIIKEAEGYERGYYTGVFGYSDGEKLESAVMIRFIEQTQNNLCFKSGGGITIYSNPESEYRELIDKVYVPFN